MHAYAYYLCVLFYWYLVGVLYTNSIFLFSKILLNANNREKMVGKSFRLIIVSDKLFFLQISGKL